MPGTAWRDETVLLVEDDDAIGMLVAEFLEEFGYRILGAEDGPGGLRLLAEAGHVDLLVTDAGLPGTNGRPIADAARTTRPDLKVLFVTDHAHDAGVGRSGELAPGMALTGKPFELGVPAAKVRSMMDG